MEHDQDGHGVQPSGDTRDLLVTTHTPALGTGQVLRTYTLVRALSAGGIGVDLLYARFGAAAPDAAFSAIPGVELHEIRASRRLRRARTYAAARVAGVPRDFARGFSPELAAAASRLAGEPRRGRVIADGPIAAGALRRLARRQPVIYNAHNLESALRDELGGIWAQRRLRAYERRLLTAASECWMVSHADVAGARELCPSARIRYVPNVVDVPSVRSLRMTADGRRSLMVADYTYAPNRQGVQFLLDEVMPHVWNELPDARLVLAGRGLDDLAVNDPRVEKLGFVEDLDGLYATASCAVVPLLQGGGTPFKFIEALAHGLPVVATPRAAAGLDVRDGEHYREASGGEEFAAGMVAALGNGDQGMGARGRQLARDRYSIEALAQLVGA